MEKHQIPDYLQDIYKEYREIVESVPEDEKKTIYWYSSMAADMKKKALEALPLGACQREIDLAIQKSQFTMVNARESELAIRGFSSSILRLFMALENDEELDEDSLMRIEVYKVIPEEERRAAIFNSKSGYYYGGHFHWIEE